MSNNKTSVVAKIFLDIMKGYNVSLSNLINVNCDSCAVLRGKKTGALKRMASEAPHIYKCDIGGDSLHHVANSFKKAAVKVFTRVNNILNNIKYEIRSSPAKVDKYIAACVEVGDNPTMPNSFCISR